MTFKDNLYKILEDLKEHKSDKTILEEKYVQERLDKTVQAYYNSLLESFNNLSSKKDITVLRNIYKEE